MAGSKTKAVANGLPVTRRVAAILEEPCPNFLDIASDGGYNPTSKINY